MTTAVTRTCGTCGLPFEVTEEELDELQRLARLRGWSEVAPPRHCLRCRMARRAERYQETPGPGESRTCASCGAQFTADEDERGRLAALGHMKRRRCEPCLMGGRR